jgi:hypothetical protein
VPDGYTKGRGLIEVSWWDKQIASGKKFRETHAGESNWPMWRNWYRGKWQPGTLPSNIYFKIARTFIPRVYYRNPSVSITPSIPGIENMLMCKLVERADNKLITRMQVKQSMKRAVQHAFMFGTGGLRLGYGAEFTPTPDELGTAPPDAGNRFRRNRVEYNDLIHPNMPWVLPAHPGNSVVPEGCSDINSARWYCYEQMRSLDDIKSDKRLKNTENLGEGIGDSKSLSAKAHSGGKVGGGVLLREVRDKKTGLVFVYAPFADAKTPRDRVLFEGEDEMQHNGRLNFYPLVFNQDDEVFWGVPLSQIISPIQLEKNETRTQIMKHRRASIAKFFYEQASITPDELEKFADGAVNGAVQVKDIHKILQMAGIQIPAGLIEEDTLMDREAQELMGLGVNQFGEYAPGSADRSATEANIVNQATQIRIDEHRDSCADLLTDLVADMNQVIIDQWTGDIVLDIVGPAGVPIWVKLQPEMMRKAVYELNVDPDTSLPLTKDRREQKAVTMFNLLSKNPLINPIELTHFLLNEVYGVYADNLLLNPMFNTSPNNPMDFGQAAQHLGALPSPNAGSLEALQAKFQQAYGQPPAQIAQQ